MFKRFIIGLVALVASAAWATEIPKLTDPVNDYARVLTANELAVLNTKILNVAKSYTDNPQIMVLTVSKLPAEGIDQYANDVYRAWGVGQKGKDNGILLVLAPNDRKVRIEVGYGLESAIPDAVANDIIQHMKPDLKSKNWAHAISVAVNELAAKLPTRTSDADVSNPNNAMPLATVKKELAQNDDPKSSNAKTNSSVSTGVLFGLLVLLGGLCYWLLRLNSNKHRIKQAANRANKTDVTERVSSNSYNTAGAKPISRGKTAASSRRASTSTSDSYLNGLTTGLIVGSSSNRKDDSDRYKSSSSDDSWSSSSSSSSSWSDSSSSSSSDSWSGGGGDSGGGGSSDSW